MDFVIALVRLLGVAVTMAGAVWIAGVVFMIGGIGAAKGVSPTFAATYGAEASREDHAVARRSCRSGFALIIIGVAICVLAHILELP